LICCSAGGTPTNEHHVLVCIGVVDVERPGDALKIERIDEEAGIADLATSAAAHEPPELLLGGPTAPLRHLLQRPESMEITVGLNDFFDGRAGALSRSAPPARR
jgi:hypothetical protein